MTRGRRWRAAAALVVVGGLGFVTAWPRADDRRPGDGLASLHAPTPAAIAAWPSHARDPAVLARVAAGDDPSATRAERLLAAAAAAQRGAPLDEEGWRAVRRAPDREVRIASAFAEGVARCSAGEERCLAYADGLFVDDEPRIREVAVDLLSRQGTLRAREALESQLAVEDDDAVRRRIARRLARWRATPSR